ncbi:MAG: GNAT family N-acetyltransferase [Natronohydrobacter sp.]|nr:GNAT family N-acetyltransferase [Natronohydrobacter sp.]
MNSFPEVIAADGVLLRPADPNDLRTVVAHLNMPDIARWMATVRHPFTDTDAEEILALAHDPSQCLRMLEVNSTMVGCLRLSPDIWFWLAPPAQGQGLMSRALHAAITAYFNTPAPPLFATCREDNLAAQSLLSRLGFSRMPMRKRLFFHNEGRALRCLEHVLCTEQWLQLHPPRMTCGALTLRPAVQKDAPALATMLPHHGTEGRRSWPPPDRIGAFIEQNRCRSHGSGLFVIEDQNRCLIGMVLLDKTLEKQIPHFMTPEASDRYSEDIETLFRDYMAGP